MPKTNHFDLNLLRVFLNVYKTGSYSMSAEELDLTPSVVSHAIKRLNNQLGETLFQRKNVGVEATFVAHDLFKQVAPAFETIEMSILGYEKFSPEETNRSFKVFVPDIFIADMITKLEAVNTSNADIICVALPPNEEQIYDALLTGEVDLVVDYIPPSLGGAASKLVTHEDICCVVNKQHPRVGDSISHSQYFSEAHAKLNLRRFDNRAAETLAKEPLPERRTHSEHNSLYSMLYTVAHSEALGLSPTRLAREFESNLNIRLLEIPFEINKIEVWVCWPKKLENNQANHWLRSIVVQSLLN
ncbi:transcriptional regulator LysR family [Vibrio astriarenae]|nr:transcriptional regulator LysR family [Vibrio sp. C7]